MKSRPRKVGGSWMIRIIPEDVDFYNINEKCIVEYAITNIIRDEDLKNYKEED